MSYRNALVTGASSGIGLSLARRLAARGTEVVLAARREELLRTAVEEIATAGGKARVLVLDVSDPDATAEAIRRVDDELGGLELVVANAGIASEKWAGKLTWEHARPTLAVNVMGAAATLTAVLPRMVERKRGHLVGISSLAGYRGLPRSAAYSASKAFLAVFLEALRVDLHGTGVAVTDVQPGFVKTAITESNKFKMPFLMELEDATERILAGIDRRASTVAFPWPLATAVRTSRLLPNGVWDRTIRAARGR